MSLQVVVSQACPCRLWCLRHVPAGCGVSGMSLQVVVTQACPCRLWSLRHVPAGCGVSGMSLQVVVTHGMSLQVVVSRACPCRLWSLTACPCRLWSLTFHGMSLQVVVTHVPEYFNFWAGKPLLERDFSVGVQKRKLWRRPKSDYGSRRLDSARKKRGWGEKEGGGVLETVVERDSAAGSEYGDGHGQRGRRAGLGEGGGDVGNKQLEGSAGDNQVSGLEDLNFTMVNILIL